MTCFAPMDRTISTFLVLHTPVTSAPNDLAICTANVPTPPDAPLIRTFCPDRICPLSRRPEARRLRPPPRPPPARTSRWPVFAPLLAPREHRHSRRTRHLSRRKLRHLVGTA